MNLPSAYTKRFTVSHTSRTWQLASEMSEALKIDRGIILGLVGHKTAPAIDAVFREVMKAECDNRTKLFMWRCSQLPNLKKKRQMGLKLRIK